jgi:hypothetical protein
MVFPYHPTMPVRGRRLVLVHGGDLGRSEAAHRMSSVPTGICWSERDRGNDRKGRSKEEETRAVWSHPSPPNPSTLHPHSITAQSCISLLVFGD